MMRWLSIFGSIVMIALGALGAERQTLPFRFDAGPPTIPPESDAVRVSSGTRYSPARGYGFLTRTQSDYHDTVAARLAIGSVADGVVSNDSIVFRIDIAPGRYLIEILMGGGVHTEWKGAVNANGHQVAGPLKCSSTNAEGQGPPPFWGIILPIENDRSSLTVSVRAIGQPTTLAGIACYPELPGPISMQKGRVIRRGPLQSPNADLILRLINAGRISEARRLVDAIPDDLSIEKSEFLFAIASRLETEAPIDLIARGRALLRERGDPLGNPMTALNIRLADLLITGNHFFRVAGWQWGKEVYREYGLFAFNNIAGMCFEEASSLPDHPLHPASLWLQGKAAYWLWVEQHDGGMIQLADSCFRTLKRWYPDHPLLMTYLSETHDDMSSVPTPPGVPRWAFLQNTIAKKTLDIIHYWVEARQADNGEFGGKYDDDVEMLRWWPIARLAFDDSLTLLGMKRLVEGIWHSGWIERGYSKKVRDVEHAAEPVADTQPMMIGFDYGNPIYVERCMESAKGLRDLWTGINGRGHRHFRSSWYSATSIDTTVPKDCDLAMNTRTVKAAMWLAWYNRHPFVMQFIREWGDAWLDDCLRTDKGKPAGVVPAAIRYSDDAIGGHADNWHHPGLFWDYYDYNGGASVLQQLLITSILLGDQKYLLPINLSLALVQQHENDDTAEIHVGTEQWAASILQNSEDFWATIELWRLTMGDTTHDDLILRLGSPYLKYFLTGHRSHLTSTMEGIASTLIRNSDLLKGEAYFTDRVELRDIREGDGHASSFLEAMYLGAALNRASYPFNRVSWEGFDSSLSVIVSRSNATSISCTLFNHSREEREGMFVTTDLLPGKYQLTIEFDLNGDGTRDSLVERRFVTVDGRRTLIPLTVVPHEEQIIELDCVERMGSDSLFDRPDLAVTSEELTVSYDGAGGAHIEASVHNIGNGQAKKSEYTLFRESENREWVVVEKGGIPSIPPPLDLDPRIVTVKIDLHESPRGRYLFRVNAAHAFSELNDSNNDVVFRVEPPK